MKNVQTELATSKTKTADDIEKRLENSTEQAQ
jgi:hypothetical protein